MSKYSMSLSGSWNFNSCAVPGKPKDKENSAAQDVWMQATVPGSVFQNLAEAGRITTTDINANPENYKWVSECGWIYRKNFDMPENWTGCDRIDLVFDGLDTVAEISLNEKRLGNVNNMFMPFRFDITKILKPHDNCLTVRFSPAGEYGKKEKEKYGNNSLFAPRAFVRKAQYQFAWDWCPPLEGCGIWQPVRIEGIKKGRIDNLHIRTIDIRQKRANIEITAELDSVAKEAFVCEMKLSRGEQVIEKKILFKPGEDRKTISIRVENPELWYPRGYGKQNFYQLHTNLINNGETVHQRGETFGIRTVKLNRKSDRYGECFEFEVNGQPVYIRGANWVPASMFPGSVADSDYKAMLTIAADSNLNMLRVWGGGYYESDIFYRLCDQLGIMVWQDFMFACAYYPDSIGFRRLVEAEAKSAIKKLRNYACLSLWCGNNEIDWIHHNRWFGRSKKFHGKAIYHRILPRLVAEMDAERNYIPSTPVASAQSKDPNDPRSGTVHQWNVWNFNAPIRDYLTPENQIPRFVTEFGIQSLPSIETIKEFCPPEQLRIGSRMLDKHNYQEHNSRIYRYIGDLFGSPATINDFSYLSQLVQARGVKEFAEHLRAHHVINRGLLFWQFNDACPAISWAAIDHSKRPKALYYYAKRFYADLLVTAVADPKSLTPGSRGDFKLIRAIAINDSSTPVKAVLKYCVMDLSGNPIKKGATAVQIDSFSRSAFLPLPEEIVSAKDSEKKVLHLVLENKTEILAENMLLLTYDKYVEWRKPKITSALESFGKDKWKLIIKSDTIVKDLYIGAGDKSIVSNNFIDMLPGRAYEIIVEIPENNSLKENDIQFNFVKSGQ
jgi:beta-mannosidase